MKARVGKIARLPEPIREQLNQRLHGGAYGKKIISWLNSLPEVNHILAEQFASNPVSENNLSEWRRGGYQDWLRERQTQTRAVQFAQKCLRMKPEDRMCHIESMIAAEFMEALQALRDTEHDDIRFHRLLRLCREFTRIQKLRTSRVQLHLQQAKSDSTRVPNPAARLIPSSTL